MRGMECGKNQREIPAMIAPEEAAARRLLRLILNPWALVSDRIASSEGILETR
jgi:hypothetical protein